MLYYIVINMDNVPVIIDSLCYLLSKLKRLDKIHLIKLMYLADRYHLMNYGRTISGDTYVALEHGPIGSQTMDVLEFDEYVLREYLPKAKESFQKGEGFEYVPGNRCTTDALDMLSESDIDALNFVITHFGNMDKWKVVDYTHELPEWKRYKDLFESGKTKREPIRIDELLWMITDDHFSVPEDHVRESLSILTGTDD
jgi:uncharacterized phage-associated protein